MRHFNLLANRNGYWMKRHGDCLTPARKAVMVLSYPQCSQWSRMSCQWEQQ
jgi:hypothetical protein